VRVALPHGESRESHLCVLSLYMPQCALTCLMPNRLCVLSSGACHMCVDLPIAASQRTRALLQSAHIARRRDVSFVDHVRVTLPHRESRDSYLAPVVVVHATMCIDMPDVASQRALPLLQSAHIARQRVFSSVVNVRVALPHSQRTSRVAPLVVVVHPKQTACPLKWCLPHVR